VKCRNTRSIRIHVAYLITEGNTKPLGSNLQTHVLQRYNNDQCTWSKLHSKKPSLVSLCVCVCVCVCVCARARSSIRVVTLKRSVLKILRLVTVRKVCMYEGVSKSFRTGHLERELRMVQLSATRCSCITIL